MNLEEIRDYCLRKKGVKETLPFGPDVLVFKFLEKSFLLLPLENDPLRFNVKCDPEIAIDLRSRYSSVHPGYHMNKKHWNTIFVDGTVSDKLIYEWIDMSYEIIAANGKRRTRK